MCGCAHHASKYKVGKGVFESVDLGILCIATGRPSPLFLDGNGGMNPYTTLKLAS